jgi:hypothetical protein
MNSSCSSLLRHPLFILAGCWALTLAPGAAAASPQARSAAAAAPAGSPAASAPDAAKTRHHLQAHVKYPASREQVLAACADTPEFSAGEQQWLAAHLPAGNYSSAAAVIAALKI